MQQRTSNKFYTHDLFIRFAMSDSYSEFEMTCNSNQIRDDELLAVLKGEVALVQGVRHRGDTAASQKDRNCNEFRGADGDTSDGTKVIQMGGRILKSLSILEDEASDIDIDHKSMMLLLNRFCIQKGIPFLPENIGQNRSGGGGRTQRQSGSSQAPAGDQNKTRNKNGGGGEADQNSRRNISKSSGRGGAGGGKRPPPPDSTSNSEPDSPRSIHVSESSEQVTSSSTGVKTEDSSRGKRKGREKSETSVLISNEESVAHRPKAAKLSKLDETDASEGIPSVAGAGRASTMRKESSTLKKKKQKGKEIVAPETNDSLTPEADLSTSTKKKSKGNRAGKSVQIEETGELEGDSSTTPADNHQKKELKRRSSYRRRLKSRSKSREEDAILITELSDISHVLRKERGNEWLEWTSSEDEAKDQDEEEEEQKKKQKTSLEKRRKRKQPVQEDLQSFMDSTVVLNKLNSILGLNPYTRVFKSNQFVDIKWVPRSAAYIGVCLNAFLFFVITISILYSLVIILGYQTPLKTTQKIVKIEFVHHFLEALFLMLFTLFLTIWAVSCILELGVHYAGFYSRFNLAIFLTKYNVTEGIHEMIVKHLVNVFLFEIIILVLFFQGYFHTSIVRESCGFLGYTILRPFNFELRESIYYPLSELFGLTVFLYSFLCLNIVLLHFAVYAKCLENMARRFNLRMAYAFGSLSEKLRSGETRVIKKVIPFKKLFAEHQIITSLIRNISHVNAIVFGAFIFSMVCEIVLVMWLFFDIILEVHPPYLEGLHIDQVGSVELAVPLRLQKNEGERLMKAFVIFSITWLTYWIFGGVLHNAGETLHIGIEYVRRQGLLRCKSSKERRFVLSMMSSFSSKTPYWIGRRFPFSRTFLVALVSFVIGASMVTVAFRPDRLSLTSIEVCNSHGTCTSIKIYKTAQNLVYAQLDVPPPVSSSSPPPFGVLPSTTVSPDVNSTQLYEHLSFYDQPPCASHGTYPLIESVMVGKFPGEWSFLSELKLPYVYKPIEIQTEPGLPGTTIRLYQAKRINESSSSLLRDCLLGQVTSSDNCGNLNVVVPSLSKLPVVSRESPELQLIAVNQIPDYPKSDERFFCCYKYILSTEKEVKVCNMESKTELENKCRFDVASSPVYETYVENLKTRRRDGSGYRDDLASGVPYDDQIRKGWTSCFCEKNEEECKKLGSATKPTVKPTRPGGTFRPPIGTTLPPPLPGQPHCFSLTDTSDNKYFIKCPIPSKTGPWADLPYISYPSIFEQVDKYTYRRILKLKSSCNPDLDGNSLPSSTSSGSGCELAIRDCANKPFTSRIGTYFEDECKNPILYGFSTRWYPDLKLRVVVLSNDRVACCIDYRLGDPIQSRKQALVCNNNEDRSFKCEDKTDQRRRECLDRYIIRWKALASDEAKQMHLESDRVVVACMCKELEYAQKKYPGQPSTPACHAHINTYHL